MYNVKCGSILRCAFKHCAVTIRGWYLFFIQIKAHENIFIFGKHGSWQRTIRCGATLNKDSLCSMVLISRRTSHSFSIGHNCGHFGSALSFEKHRDFDQLFSEQFHNLISYGSYTSKIVIDLPKKSNSCNLRNAQENALRLRHAKKLENSTQKQGTLTVHLIPKYLHLRCLRGKCYRAHCRSSPALIWPSNAARSVKY